MTKAQFAEDLAQIASGYVEEPAIEATGLTGTAVDRQPDLKLELRKRPMPVRVIDHADEQPNGN